MVEACVKENYYAKFHTPSYHCCREMHFISRLNVNFLDNVNFDEVSGVKGTSSWCVLEECVKDNYYARFHTPSYHCCREMHFISRLHVNFLGSTQNFDKVSGA